MILEYIYGRLEIINSYRKAFHLEGENAPIVALVGAGGKTTTIFHLADEYCRAGITPVITTTTHMQIEEKGYELLEESMSELQTILKREGMAQVGQVDVEKAQKGVHKIKSVSDTFFMEICSLGIPVLVEADGAKHLPCKVPAAWEPVIPRKTTKVVSVYGLDAVGRRILDTCFRPEAVAKLLKKEVSDMVEPEDIALLAVHEEGGRKGVGDIPYQVLLNKADDRNRIEIAGQICRMLEFAGITDVIVTSERMTEDMISDRVQEL